MWRIAMVCVRTNQTCQLHTCCQCCHSLSCIGSNSSRCEGRDNTGVVCVHLKPSNCYINSFRLVIHLWKLLRLWVTCEEVASDDSVPQVLRWRVPGEGESSRTLHSDLKIQWRTIWRCCYEGIGSMGDAFS